MGKKSNGQLRKARHAETIIRKGLDQVQPTDGYAYVYGEGSRHLTQRG